MDKLYEFSNKGLPKEIFLKLLPKVEQAVNKFVACCPVCKKIFIRKRKDHIYCCHRCSSTGSTRNFRRRQKTNGK
jgi:ribosomal protein L37AE/L43A